MGRARRVQDGSIDWEPLSEEDLQKAYTEHHRIQLDGALIANKRILRRRKMKKFGIALVIGLIIFFAIYVVYGVLIALGPRM